MSQALRYRVHAACARHRRCLGASVETTRRAEGTALWAALERDQSLNIRVIWPGIMLFCAASAAAIWARPDLFVDRRWHLALAAAECAGSVAYLAYTLLYFRAVATRIASEA